MTELLDAVDALTKPVIEHFAQKDDSGAWLRAHTTHSKPLLQQLDEAVRSSPGGGGRSGGSDPWGKNMLDSDALLRARQIRADVNAWCRLLSVRPSKDMVSDLRRWYVAHAATERDTDHFYLVVMRGWAGQIKGMLDRPKQFEVTQPCPICDKFEWEDAEGNVVKFPIVVTYRDNGTAEPVKPTALCRACKAVWPSLDSIEELGEEMQEKFGA